MTDTRQLSQEKLVADLEKQLSDRFGTISEEELAARQTSTVPPPGRRPTVDLTVQTPTGESIEVKKLRAVGEQDFYYYGFNDEVKLKHFSGEYLLYVYSTPGYHVLLGWRGPHEAAESIQLEALADAVVGTIAIGEAADADAQIEQL